MDRRFHAIYLPAILSAMNLDMPKTLLTHAHWTAGQKKMSKSLGNVADPIAAMEDFGVDTVRFYLARVGGRFRDDVGEFRVVCLQDGHPLRCRLVRGTAPEAC